MGKSSALGVLGWRISLLGIYSKFKSTVFKDCTFSGNTFINCVFNDVTFINCVFIGQHTTFYKSTVKKIAFVRCSVEYLDKWVMTSEPGEIKKILAMKLLDTTKCDVV